MKYLQISILSLIWSFGFLFIIKSIYFEFNRVRFNFNILFSLMYLLIFYLGFPLTNILTVIFNTSAVSITDMQLALCLSTCFYITYYISYKINLRYISDNNLLKYNIFTINCTEIHLLWIMLMSIAVISTIIFYIHNGFLLFKLHSYSEIFSSSISGLVFKRFFYFFIPSVLIIYFLYNTFKVWIILFITTVLYGTLTYIIVGGTRANIIISFIIFLSIGVIRKWISLGILIIISLITIIIIFLLALKRYNIHISYYNIIYTFFYFTRDTISPWENLALLLHNYNIIEFQGLTPIVRDFYTFIPVKLWHGRPKIILNTATYFTWNILNNYSGLIISPTLIGSLIIMGGSWFIFPGAVIVAMIIKSIDYIYFLNNHYCIDYYKKSVLNSFCFSIIFHVIILIREGLDSFFSRLFFFTVVFIFVFFLSKIIYSFIKEIKSLF